MSILNLVPTSAHLNTGVGKGESGQLTITYPCRLTRADKIELSTAEKWADIEILFSARTQPDEGETEPGAGRIAYFAAFDHDFGVDPASVICESFVTGEQLAELIAAARSGRMPSKIIIDVDGMTYGNAPDGSEKRWDNKKSPRLKMEVARFNLPLITPAVTEETDIEDASRVANEPPTRAQFDALLQLAAVQRIETRKTLFSIFWAVVVLGLVVIIWK